MIRLGQHLIQLSDGMDRFILISIRIIYSIAEQIMSYCFILMNGPVQSTYWSLHIMQEAYASGLISCQQTLPCDFVWVDAFWRIRNGAFHMDSFKSSRGSYVYDSSNRR